MRIDVWIMAGALCVAAGMRGMRASADAEERCAAPEYRQFDFFVGNWNAFDVTNPGVRVATNRVSKTLGGCVVLEDYEGENGSHGESFSIYDAAAKKWHQTWVTNHGQLVMIDGAMHGDEMVLEGVDHANGVEKYVRGTWKAVGDGVRETAVTSMDHGKTWTPWFDLIFRRANGTGDDAKSQQEADAVAALDTEYQAAVKRNDASVMEKILADDFVLVTGSGKTYTKKDLLEEARSGRVQYEHQEELTQKVRVFGDTAVVTAKLWEKGTDSGKAFDWTIWFSDTYVKTAAGWRYVFGQSSYPPPKN
jgi:ketosteroid isomerase-like protein